MKKILSIIVLALSSTSFAGGEISFVKQKEKIKKVEEAELIRIQNGVSTEIKTEENTSLEEEVLDVSSLVKKKSIIKK